MSDQKDNTPVKDYFEDLKDSSYRGNANLKDGVQTVDVPVDVFEYYTSEIIKCRKDIVYFANKYYHIISGKKGKHVIETYPKQNELLQAMRTQDRLCVLASRQTGKCVTGDTMIEVRNKETGEEFTISISDFYKQLQDTNE